MRPKRHLSPAQVMNRLLKDDVLERFENYATFKFDGARVRLNTIRKMIENGTLNDAKPNIGARYTRVNQLGILADFLMDR